MKRQSLLRVLVLALLMLLPTGTSFAAGSQDKLVGSGQLDLATYGKTHFVVSAHSGPGGEDPHGQVSFPYLHVKGKITCLNVQGNTAVAVARLDEPFAQVPGATVSDLFLYINDNGAPGQFSDNLTSSIWTYIGRTPGPVTSCVYEFIFNPVSRGNFVITDAMP